MIQYKILIFNIMTSYLGILKYIYINLLSPKPLRYISDRIISLFIPKKLHIAEGVVILDQNDVGVSGSLALGLHDPFEIEQFRKDIQPGMTVIDIGANIGYYTVIAAYHVGTQGQVLSFEPEQNNFDLLQKNIKANNFTWAKAYKTALSDTSGSRSLFLADSHTGIYSFANNRNSKHHIQVITNTLDNYLEKEKVNKVDIIKMDIEGGEMLAIDGMKKTITNNPRLILFVEFYPQAIERLGRKPIELLEKINALGLSLSFMNEDKKVLTPLLRANFATFVNNFPKKGEIITNLRCLKKL